MAANVVRFGPGTFKLGPTGTELVFDCQVQSMGVNVNKNTGDTITVLCGDTVPGAITYDYTLAGTFMQDLGTADGIMQHCWDNKGITETFVFVPATSATTSVTGQVIVDPLQIADSGASFGDVLTTDFEFSMVGEPDITWPAGG